jgi:hypothetical protein
MDIEVQIEGVTDRTVAAAIRSRVRRVSRVSARPGEWRITVSPSETRGQWDLGVQAPSGRHFASFSETIDRLPELIERKLRECLDLPSPGVQTAADGV